MADFEPPSFSLGLDFDLDSKSQTTVRKDPPLSKQAQPSSTTNPSFRLIDDDDDDFETPPMGQHQQQEVSEPPRALKRLRRGGPASRSAPAAPNRVSVELCSNNNNVDDDIEEFSSQEDRCKANEHSSMHYHSGCSSSKFPLHGHGVLTTQSANQREPTKRKWPSNTTASTSFETSSDKLMFPKLTVSPLRRFQLLDSDDPSVSEVGNKVANKVDSSLKEKHYDPTQYPATSGQKRTKTSVSMSPTEDLWKDFNTDKGSHIPTPALDEFCEEYFGSVKDKNEAANLSQDKCTSDSRGFNQHFNVINSDEDWCKLGVPIPPAHHYFFHKDPRIQSLVHSRLPYFFPLGAMNNSGNKLPISSVDYMSQFGHGEGSKQQAGGKTNARTSSTTGRKNSKKSNPEEAAQGSGSWVNPKSCASIPKDAGKRRVQAVGQSAGHWYTDPHGKRVYVAKNGQELSGRMAYRHYRKESGAGFKKSKKKGAAKKGGFGKKKKTAAKK